MSEKAASFIKHAVIVLFAAVIGVLLGHMVSSYETRYMLGRKYLGSYKNIEIYTSGEVNEEYLSGHLKMLDYAPDALLGCCDRIYFSGNDLPSNDSGYGQALGITQNRIIYISTASFGADVMLHELFHAYDSANDTPSANSREFRDAFAQEKNTVRIVAGNDSLLASEFFAEAGAMYLLSPFELQIRAPMTYEYFQSVFD